MKECLYYELAQKGLNVEKQKPMPLFFKKMKMEVGYRVDLLVENSVVAEVKAADAFNGVHLAQILITLN